MAKINGIVIQQTISPVFLLKVSIFVIKKDIQRGMFLGILPVPCFLPAINSSAKSIFNSCFLGFLICFLFFAIVVYLINQSGSSF